MISEDLKRLLNKNEYLILATSSLNGKPNAAPMFLIKAENQFIYLIDYTLGTTWNNLKVNKQVSISTLDLHALNGFKLNGIAEIFEKGSVYDEIVVELEKKTLKLTTDRIINGVKKNIKYRNFELGILKKFVVYKIEIKEVVQIGPQGRIQKA